MSHTGSWVLEPVITQRPCRWPVLPSRAMVVFLACAAVEGPINECSLFSHRRADWDPWNVLMSENHVEVRNLICDSADYKHFTPRGIVDCRLTVRKRDIEGFCDNFQPSPIPKSNSLDGKTTIQEVFLFVFILLLTGSFYLFLLFSPSLIRGWNSQG